MHRRMITLVLVLMSSSMIQAQDLALFDSALAQVGMNHTDVRFDQTEMATWGGNQWQLSYFTMFHQSPFKLPKYGKMNLEAFTGECENVAALITDAGRKIDCPVRRSLIGDPLEKYLNPKDSTPKVSYLGHRNLLTGPQYDRLRNKIDLLCALLDDPDFGLTKAYQAVSPADYRTQLFQYFVSDSQKYNDLVERLANQIDLNRLVAGSEDLAEVLQKTADSLEFCQFPDAPTEISTKWGLIVLGTKADDKYDYSAPPLLILDPGGNDTYRISGSPAKYPVTAIIDASGNDTYISNDSTSPGIGGAILGVSIVIDKSGDDRYEAMSVAQGCGIFGVGAVIDLKGKDSYRAKFQAQGAGTFGSGILADSSGDDSLYCWANAQGYGYTRGCGLCVNGEGNDVYVAEDSIIFSPGQQTKEHNSSLAQGVGFGKRADYVDGHSWAGGIGILCDIAGDDKYSAGLFAQGCGYWFGLGMLLDGSGNDNYLSAWYTMGSGAHFAVGYLDDFSGNDNYNVTMNMSLGSGHDFTIGYFNDRGGNDVYHAPGLSLGGGNFQGIGIFDDWSGDDTYYISGDFNVGGARGLLQGPRAYLNTFGLFVDGGGKDTYSDSRYGDNRHWIGRKSDPAKPDPFEIGVGIDR